MDKINLAIFENKLLLKSGFNYIVSSVKENIHCSVAENKVHLMQLLHDENIDILICSYGYLQKCKVLFKQIKEDYPLIKTLLIVESPVSAKTIVELNVDGVVNLSVTPHELETALHNLMNGKKYYTGNLVNEVFDEVRKKEKKERENIPELTQKEKQIILLICDELDTKEIASSLNLSNRTIEGYRPKIFEKVGCKNIAGLVKFALDNYELLTNK